ncbi:MAG: pyridine nucleotide-disulfide oxidoreductase [Legionellaceae bacterium]|nr:pyridine nucleotide-disulfide oxidoreductase [Legionellaceae bacterium]
MNLKLKHFDFKALFEAEKLQELDVLFLQELAEHDDKLHRDLLSYRSGKSFSPLQTSELLIHCAKALEHFLAELFSIEVELEKSKATISNYTPIMNFKKWFVMRRAKRHLLRDENLPSFSELSDWLKTEIKAELNEYKVALYAEKLLEEKDLTSEKIEKLTQWCIQAIKTPEGRVVTKAWASLKLPQRRDYQRLIPIIPVEGDAYGRQQLPTTQLRQRDGFDLTDHRMSTEQVLDEIHYCVFCHENEGDFCSKGFPVKKGDDSQGLRDNALGNTLTGCPLEEKISEMHALKRDAFTIGALAMVMVDNPMCPATGHRICNDCMKACIYQKQDPVDIPQIETRVLTDVLALPWGVEIYDLLTRWNPLRAKQWVSKPYNGHKIMIAGMGPAGFTLAHHLLMEGFAVTGVDGLKIEPIDAELLDKPIKDYDALEEKLSERVLAGFGGVAEYGITVRWDKNFLKLIYLNLMRRPYFQLFGNTRFGGTVTVEKAWELGFDHLAVAVGAGLPKALPIPGSMAPGMRQANDFLMALQLTGAAKADSLANLELRMPVVVIGGGLTGVDTATEAQAYYIKQIEKIAERYEKLDHKLLASKLNSASTESLQEFLAHAEAIKAERERAKEENRAPDFISLVHSWGGVTIAYRREMQASPAYRVNHEELYKALEEGIYYAEQLQPVKILLDQHGHVSAIECVHAASGKTISLPAKSILVATGANLNIAYEFEHTGTFDRDGMQYRMYEQRANQLVEVHKAPHVKSEQIGAFTSYQHDKKLVSFLGDSHPVFHGSVVKAIASAMQTYPKIVELFDSSKAKSSNNYQDFREKLNDLFLSQLKDVKRCTDNVVEITIHAPLAAEQFKPGCFYRLQNYETYAKKINGTTLQTEAVALAAFNVNKDAGTLTFMLQKTGASSRILAQLQPGENVALMGPSGVRSKIPDDKQTVLIIGEQMSLAYVRAVAPALKDAGNKVIFIGLFQDKSELYCENEINAITDFQFYANQPDGLKEILLRMIKDHSSLITSIDRVSIIGTSHLLREFQTLRNHELHNLLKTKKLFGSVYAPMQCMLKGVCSQCLTWQIDPETGERKKAVFACSWQDQPIDYIDLDNLDDRLMQNQLSETVATMWLDYIFK